MTLLRPNWQAKLKSAEQAKDKFEFFNDNLKNLFKDEVQFGVLKLDLAKVVIPLLAQTTKAAKSYRAMD